MGIPASHRLPPARALRPRDSLGSEGGTPCAGARRPIVSMIGVGLVVALVVAGCGRVDISATPERSPETASDAPTLAATSEPSPANSPSGVAPVGRRVDLGAPTFSHPTAITNPLFPIVTRRQVIQLGEEEGEPARVEITLLPVTRTIDWDSRQVENRVVQFVAYRGGRIVEVAVDYFAQADDGAVWYFGEEVDNYEEGVVADHHGSWLAGVDGPPGMIMPARPGVGDVYRPENIPGLVFEETTVKSSGLAVAGPSGLVEGAIRVEEHLMEGTVETKVFAPGYGEFEVRAADEVVFVALAVPIDAIAGPPPTELDTLLTGAADLFEAAPAGHRDGISATLELMTTAWDRLAAVGLPEVLAARMTDELAALADAVDARRPADARLATIRVSQAALDLELRHRPVAEIDLARLELWARQALLDSGSNPDAVAGDVAALETIWARVGHAIAATDVRRVNGALRDLRAAVDAGDPAAVVSRIARLRGIVVGLEPAA